MGSHSTYTFDAVQIIKQPGIAAIRVRVDREILAKPGQGAFNAQIAGMLTTALDLTPFNGRVAIFQLALSHDHRRDSGARHATGAILARMIPPGAVRVLCRLPVI